MIDRLLALIPWYYRWLAFAALIAASMAYGAAMMHRHDVKVLDKLEADIAKAQAVLEAERAERKRASDRLIREKDNERGTQVADAHRWWAAYVDGLLKRGGPGQGKEPVRIAATVCGDAARDHRLSVALADYRDGVAAGLAKYREGVAGLLAACEVQTRDLMNLQDWAIHEQLINAVPQ